jgi:acetyl-CoA carboxylase carboxyltransferase component
MRENRSADTQEAQKHLLSSTGLHHNELESTVSHTSFRPAHMSVIHSQLKKNSPEFKQNEAQYRLLAEELQRLLQSAAQPADENAIKLARERKKMLAAERVEALVDEGSPILEIAPLAGLGVDGATEPGAGISTCLGTVEGRHCMIIANNSAVKGGSYFPMTIKKHLRAQELAFENALPCLYLVDSGGAYLPLQAQVFPDRFHFGRIFYNQARMSACGIPQLSAVLGSSTAGGAYVPAMSDETIMVRGNASIFLGGPPLVKAATGEEVSAEQLGGAEVHCTKSGVADHLAEDEIHALRILRSIVRSLGPERAELRPRLLPDQAPEAPLYPSEEIYGIVGGDLKKSFSCREVLARLVDGSRFEEFKKDYGTTIICGFAHILGYRVGIIANDGILFSESALKATHFIELCNQRLIPLLFVQNIVGFMVGKTYEQEGIAKHGAKMVSAVATSRVPTFTLIIGGSFGAGNYGMCGRAYDPRFLFTWPNSRISVMGGTQAARVLTDIKMAAGQRKNRPPAQDELEAYHRSITEKYEQEGGPYYATARLWDDGVIDPARTRQVLALAFANTLFDPSTPYRPGVFRM